MGLQKTIIDRNNPSGDDIDAYYKIDLSQVDSVSKKVMIEAGGYLNKAASDAGAMRLHRVRVTLGRRELEEANFDTKNYTVADLYGLLKTAIRNKVPNEDAGEGDNVAYFADATDVLEAGQSK